jgi:hypothetical protein
MKLTHHTNYDNLWQSATVWSQVLIGTSGNPFSDAKTAATVIARGALQGHDPMHALIVVCGDEMSAYTVAR